MDDRPGAPELPDRVLDAALRRAIELASTGPIHGPNPRVGCVLLAEDAASARPGTRLGDWRIIAEGRHRGAGTPHAEADALADARARGEDARGAIAVVTLEPCAHTGRTGPCAEALLDAGIGGVVYAVDDPNPSAAGGAARLRSRGVPVRSAPTPEADALVDRWRTAVARGTPFVTLKLATTLDGFVAAADGTSRWITGSAAREHAHRRRTQLDAIALGTGTALADDPALTARRPDGSLAPHQPLRVVVGMREVPAGARLRGPGGEFVHLRTHDLAAVLADLGRREIRHLLIEGGSGLATAAIRADLVDELDWYLAPTLLGAGRRAIADLGIRTLRDASRWTTVRTESLGDDLFLRARRA